MGRVDIPVLYQDDIPDVLLRSILHTKNYNFYVRQAAGSQRPSQYFSICTAYLPVVPALTLVFQRPMKKSQEFNVIKQSYEYF
jgi:hypothetical protein